MTKIAKSKSKIKPKNLATIKESAADLITVVLLCDSPGYRMKSYGPIPLINIANHRLIDLQIKAIKQTFTNYEIILCVGFDAEKICRYVRTNYSSENIRIVENQIYSHSNSCESVRLSLNNTLNNKIVICEGNLLITNKVLSLIKHDQTCVIVESDPSKNLEIGINIDENDNAEYFSFGASKIWSEVLYLHDKEIIEHFRKIVESKHSKNKFIFEAINEIIKTKHKVKCLHNTNRIHKINTIKTYHAMKDMT